MLQLLCSWIGYDEPLQGNSMRCSSGTDVGSVKAKSKLFDQYVHDGVVN